METNSMKYINIFINIDTVMNRIIGKYRITASTDEVLSMNHSRVVRISVSLLFSQAVAMMELSAY